MGTTSNTIPVSVDVDPWQRCMELGEEADALRRAAAEQETEAGGRIAALEAELAAARADLTAARAELTERDAENSGLRQELEEKERTSAEAVGKLESELATARIRMAERDSKILKLQDELDAKGRSLATL